MVFRFLPRGRTPLLYDLPQENRGGDGRNEALMKIPQRRCGLFSPAMLILLHSPRTTPRIYRSPREFDLSRLEARDRMSRDHIALCRRYAPRAIVCREGHTLRVLPLATLRGGDEGGLEQINCQRTVNTSITSHSCIFVPGARGRVSHNRARSLRHYIITCLG